MSHDNPSAVVLLERAEACLRRAREAAQGDKYALAAAESQRGVDLGNQALAKLAADTTGAWSAQ